MTESPEIPDWFPDDEINQVDWQTLYTQAAEQVEALDLSQVTAIAEASTIVEEWAEVAAYLIVVSDSQNITPMMKDNATKTLSARTSGKINKSAIDDTLDTVIEEKESQNNCPIDEVLEQGIKEIVERRTTDHTNRTIWSWTVDFEKETVQFTTRVTKNGIEHFDPRAIQNALYEGTGYRPDAPSPRIHASCESDDGWSDWIAEFIRRHRQVETVTGERTRFVEDVIAYISNHPAYTTLEDAIVRDGVYVDDEEADVYVPGDSADRFRDDHSLHTNECVTELDARDLTSDTVNGVSTRVTKKVDGDVKRRRYWVLDLEVLESLDVDPVLMSDSDDQDPGDREGENESGGLDPSWPEADGDVLSRLPTAATDGQETGDTA